MNISRINLVMGDITKMETDAIVNAANSSLMGGAELCKTDCVTSKETIS